MSILENRLSDESELKLEIEDLLNEKSMWEELEKSLISKLKQLEAENIKLKEAKNEKKLNSFNQNEHS